MSFTSERRCCPFRRIVRTAAAASCDERSGSEELLGEAEDRGERGPDLVAHVREEVALRSGRRLGRLLRAAEFLGLLGQERGLPFDPQPGQLDLARVAEELLGRPLHSGDVPGDRGVAEELPRLPIPDGEAVELEHHRLSGLEVTQPGLARPCALPGHVRKDLFVEESPEGLGKPGEERSGVLVSRTDERPADRVEVEPFESGRDESDERASVVDDRREPFEVGSLAMLFRDVIAQEGYAAGNRDDRDAIALL